MIDVNIDVLPPVVWNLWTDLLDKTEIEPQVRRVGYGHLLVTHGNERVTVRVHFKNKGRTPKWTGHSSDLHIDGKKVPRAHDVDHYVAILKDPDYGRHSWAPEGARKARIPGGRPVENEDLLPALVADHLKAMRGQIGTGPGELAECEITVRSADNSQYVLSMNAGERKSSFFIVYQANGDAWTVIDLRFVNSLGYDVTLTYENGIDDFFYQLMGDESRKVQVPTTPQQRTTQTVGLSNSVSVRKASVFRI